MPDLETKLQSTRNLADFCEWQLSRLAKGAARSETQAELTQLHFEIAMLVTRIGNLRTSRANDV